LAEIRKAGDQLLAEARQILGAGSNAPAQRSVLQSVPFDLGAVVDGISGIMAARAAFKGARLSCVIAPNTPRALIGDPERLRQFLFNLLGGAIDSVTEGSIGLMVESFPRADGATLVFGLSWLEEMPAGGNPGANGALKLCREIVEAMGGRTEDTGRGSAYRAAIPFLIAGATPLGAGPKPSLESVRVLVAGECSANRTIASNMLASLGSRVAAAASMEGALEEFRRGEVGGSYQVVLVDLDAPGGKPGWLMEQLQAGGSQKQPGVVAVGCDDSAARRAWIASTGAAFLARPYRKVDLAEAISNELARCRAVQSKSESAEPAGSVCRILLIGEPASQQAVIARRLNGYAHDLTYACDARAAEEAFHAREFDVVFVAMGARQLKLRQTVREMRAWEAGNRGKSTPFIAITTQALAGRPEWGGELGCEAQIGRPIQRAELLDVMRRYGKGIVVEERAGPDEASEAIRTLVPRYLEIQRAELAALRDPVRNMESHAVLRYAQGLSGTAAQLGLAHLGILGSKLESASRQDNWPKARRYLDAIGEYLNVVASTLLKCA
jgi:CheY-like chemotaxis protein